MDSVNAISKAIFTFQNGLNGAQSKKRRGKFQIHDTNFDEELKIQPWDEEFESMWHNINSKIEAFQTANNEEGLVELIRFVEQSYSSDGSQENAVAGTTYLPVAALLTGINKPDHHQYFKTFADKMNARNNGHIAILPARDCPNLKSTIEALVSCIICNGHKYNFRDDEEYDEEEDVDMGDVNSSLPQIKLKRNQYTLDVLHSWYSSLYAENSNKPKSKITIIMPNFEEFSSDLIQDLVLILSNHCSKLPIVLILGVATSATSIFQTLSVNETTRIKLSVFMSQSSNTTLNTILDNILLTPEVQFQLDGRIFTKLKDIFLFYDFTTKEFLKAFHFCMLEHYSQGNAFSLCTSSYSRSLERIEDLTHEDIERIRRLPSFKRLPEFQETTQKSVTRARRIVKYIENDEFIKEELKTHVADIFSYFLVFHCFARVLFLLVKDLPQTPLGKTLNRIYAQCLNGPIVHSDEFQQCRRILETTSKDVLMGLIMNSIETMETFIEKYCPETNEDSEEEAIIAERSRQIIDNAMVNILKHADILTNVVELDTISTANEVVIKPESRDDWKKQRDQQLIDLQNVKRKTHCAVIDFLDFLQNDLFENYLKPFAHGPPFIELFVFSRTDLVRAHIIGAPRGAIHTALTNPQVYLDCNCCILDNPDGLLPTLPDISVAYKLLLESGKHVNLYDWLQSFWYILEGTDDDTGEVPHVIQARFLRARAELELLGYIKTSKRKTDHVTKLVW